MRKDHAKIIEEKLNIIIGLQRHLLALELAKQGVPKQAIAKRIRVATATVVKMLQGVSKNV